MERAKAILDLIPANLVTAIREQQSSKALLFRQVGLIKKMVEEGLLSAKHADELLSEMQENSEYIEAERDLLWRSVMSLSFPHDSASGLNSFYCLRQHRDATAEMLKNAWRSVDIIDPLEFAFRPSVAKTNSPLRRHLAEHVSEAVSPVFNPMGYRIPTVDEEEEDGDGNTGISMETFTPMHVPTSSDLV